MPGSVKIGPDDPILGENDLRRRTTAAEVAAATGEDGDTPIFDVWILTVSPARSPSLKVSPGDVLIEGQHVVAPPKISESSSPFVRTSTRASGLPPISRVSILTSSISSVTGALPHPSWSLPWHWLPTPEILRSRLRIADRRVCGTVAQMV